LARVNFQYEKRQKELEKKKKKEEKLQRKLEKKLPADDASSEQQAETPVPDRESND